MASDVERNRRGGNNNINLGSQPHGLPGGTSAITEGEVLIESEFLELNNQLHYSKTVHILLTDEFVFVKEMRDRRDSEAHVLQYESAKTVTKFRRSDVTITLCDGCPFTFKAKWNKDTSPWKTYELCGKEEVWPKWLRSFSVEEPRGLEMIPSKCICEIGGDSDSDDCSEDDDGEDVQIPEHILTHILAVDTISTWSVSMLNPSRVRRLAITQQRRPALPSLSSSNASELEDLFDNLNDGSLHRSNSHPRLSLVKPFRCSSLPNVGDLENVRVDTDLRIHECRTRGQSSADDPNLKFNSSGLLIREGESSDKNVALATLQQRVEDLRARPTNLNFVRRGKGDEAVWEALTTPRHHRKHSLCLAMSNEANRIPMPSDSTYSSRLVRRSPVLNNKQDSSSWNKKIAVNHDNKTRDLSLSPKKTDLTRNIKHSLKSLRSDSLPSSGRPDLSHVTHSVWGRENKSSASRRLDFKDDMAVTLSESNQPPRKEKVKRFLSVLYKKRPKLRMQAAESDDSLKENDTRVRNVEGNLSSVEDFDAPNGVVGGVRRGGFSGNLPASKDKNSGLVSTKEEAVPPLHTKQDSSSSGETTPAGRSHFSYSGSMRKKKLVKKILSPIFKSSSQEEEISYQATSPAGEVPQTPDVINGYLPDLPQRLVDIDAALFAREITLIDKELFIRIPWRELANCGWMTKDKYVTSPNVMAMVEFFNRVALLAASEILSQDTPSGRARAISKVIQIAEKCHLLGNFNSLKALLAGLQSTPVYRLKESWKEVPSKRKKKFRDLSILMGESENFSLYRAELSHSLESGACLPFLGNFLTEIAQRHTYLAYRRKKVLTGGKQSPQTRRNNDKINLTDEVVMNGKTPTRNGVTTDNGKTERDGQTSPRDANDRESVTQESNDKRNAKVKRTPSRSKLFRFHNRQSINDSGVMLNRSRNNSTEVLDIPDGNLRRGLTSSSDSVITSTSSLNESSSPRNATSGSSNSRTPSRPPLLRRLSETSTNQNGSPFSLKTPKRRMSETKSSETRRSFLKGLVRRTPSSQSVKEGRVSRGSSSEKLTVSLSTLSMSENSNHLKSFVERLAKSQSSPSVKEDVIDGRLSPEFSPGPLDGSPEVEAKRSSIHHLLVEDSPNGSNHELQSGTEKQLWTYQIASIQYDFVSRPFVRHFLLNASFNSEEDNYRLSLKRETPSKKTNS